MRLKVGIRERRRRERLASLLISRKPLDEILEWLWEDFGIRVSKPSAERVRRILVEDASIRDRDLASYLVSEGIPVSDDDWDARD